MCKHVVVATRCLPPRNVGLALMGMPSALEPQVAGMAAVCPTAYADDTHAITLAPAAAPMAARLYGWPTWGSRATQSSPPTGSCNSR